MKLSYQVSSYANVDQHRPHVTMYDPLMVSNPFCTRILWETTFSPQQMDQHIFFEKSIWVHLCPPTLKSEHAILVFKTDRTNLPASCHLAEIPDQLTQRKIAFFRSITDFYNFFMLRAINWIGLRACKMIRTFSACYIYLKTKKEEASIRSVAVLIVMFSCLVAGVTHALYGKKAYVHNLAELPHYLPSFIW
jgi:hypothetical protein